MAPPDSSPWPPGGCVDSASSRARRRSLAQLSGFGCREWLPGSTPEYLAPVASSSCFSWSGSEATTTCLLAGKKGTFRNQWQSLINSLKVLKMLKVLKVLKLFESAEIGASAETC